LSLWSYIATIGSKTKVKLRKEKQVMAKENTAGLDELLKEVKADKIGTASLDDWKDTLFGDQAQKLLPGAKSVVVLAMEVFPETIAHVTSKAVTGDLALRDLYLANSDVIDGLLDWEGYKMVKQLHAKGFKGLLLPAKGGPYDARFLKGPFSYKNAAEAAGLGITGWHSLLITPEYGARVRLACIITDAPFPSSAPLNMESPCPKCGGACIKICPAKAIARPQEGEPYRLNKYACSAYYDASGMCSECLSVCPAGRASE
jgi:epoxyqueuosine reductase